MYFLVVYQNYVNLVLNAKEAAVYWRAYFAGLSASDYIPSQCSTNIASYMSCHVPSISDIVKYNHKIPKQYQSNNSKNVYNCNNVEFWREPNNGAMMLSVVRDVWSSITAHSVADYTHFTIKGALKPDHVMLN